MSHFIGRKAVRFAASVFLFSLLGSLAGCGGGGGASKATATTAASNTTAILKTIEVTPSVAQAAAGTLTQFKATGIYSDNSKQDFTTRVTWATPTVDGDSEQRRRLKRSGNRGWARQHDGIGDQ